jgi:hypothetical protein
MWKGGHVRRVILQRGVDLISSASLHLPSFVESTLFSLSILSFCLTRFDTVCEGGLQGTDAHLVCIGQDPESLSRIKLSDIDIKGLKDGVQSLIGTRDFALPLLSISKLFRITVQNTFIGSWLIREMARYHD